MGGAVFQESMKVLQHKIHRAGPQDSVSTVAWKARLCLKQLDFHHMPFHSLFWAWWAGKKTLLALESPCVLLSSLSFEGVALHCHVHFVVCNHAGNFMWALCGRPTALA
eukprot:947836-Amphidinium_carterae.1